jgi:hypothetical protein
VAWVDPDTHGSVHHPKTDAEWAKLLADFEVGTQHHPLAQVFRVARANRARTVIDENRYIDSDYRSEYSAFWADRFPSRPAFSRRLHFFRRTVTDSQLHDIPRNAGYLGYSTLKPIMPGRVGRTMMAPPPRLNKATLTMATDKISLFGSSFEVTGSPFLEQDTEFLVCAHAAAWMCHYHAALRGLVGRRHTAELVGLAPALYHERALPSPGLRLNQLQAVFGATGQPALFYGIGALPTVEGVETPVAKLDSKGRVRDAGYWDTRMFSVICRYLNAGFPVMIATMDHAFVIVGWYRDGTRIRFIACDDNNGPYEVITSPFTDARAPWQAIMVPLPPKVYLSGEMAESTTHMQIRAYAKSQMAVASWQDLAARLTAGTDIGFRTFLRSNFAYKRVLPKQGRGDSAVRALRLARLPHWVWVVEAHDRTARRARKPSVLAEWVYDSTSRDKRPTTMTFSLPGAVAVLPPDEGDTVAVAGPTGPWRSHFDVAPQP